MSAHGAIADISTWLVDTELSRRNFSARHVGFYCLDVATSDNDLSRLNLPLDRRLREPQNLALRLFLLHAR
jgi:hypothetical protein